MSRYCSGVLAMAPRNGSSSLAPRWCLSPSPKSTILRSALCLAPASSASSRSASAVPTGAADGLRTSSNDSMSSSSERSDAHAGLAKPACASRRSLEELMLSFEDVRKPSAAPVGTADALRLLAELAGAKHSALRKIVLFGDGDKHHLGAKLLEPFLGAIASTPLQYLDISSQLLGDAGAPMLARLVCHTRSLQTLVLDDNHLTAAGFDLVRKAMESAYSICNMPYPRLDVRRACAASKNGAKKIHAVLMEIKALLKRNRKREENIKVIWVGEESEEDDSDEMSSDDETDGDDTAAREVLGQGTVRGRGARPKEPEAAEE
eukprot:TRINITY_DN8225_c0_g1_i1.p1 TRINITY_DN8225_c0_g1~~TRINITY_DN8225_c0_g1_i1.p1  ORF type:complete len:320 (+),score=163.29 TRINITY_DN8225_c0_g1_i1:476-1435(+)